MKLADIGMFAYGLTISQFLAPLLVLDLPRISRIKVNELKERDAFTREYVLHRDPSGRESTIRVRPESPGTKTVLKLEDDWGIGYVILDHNTQTISSNGNHHWWGSSNIGGSGDLGVLIFGIPGLLLSSPILILNGLLWRAVYSVTGMDRHQLSFYLRVKNQVDSYTQNLLKQALKKASAF